MKPPPAYWYVSGLEPYMLNVETIEPRANTVDDHPPVKQPASPPDDVECPYAATIDVQLVSTAGEP